MLEQKVLERELLAGPDAMLASWARIASSWGGRDGLQGNVQELEELGLDKFLVELGPGHLGRRHLPGPAAGRQKAPDDPVATLRTGALAGA